VTILQFRENLADRQAAEAVRARIDWKYLLSLELTDPGFDFSVLSAFRDRLLAGSAEALLLDKLLERCRTLGLLKARGQQRTDSTHVLAAIRVMHRLELVAETLRAALNALATVAPAWLQALAPLAWYERYGKRIEDTRLPQGKASRDAYAQMVGEDGFALLGVLEATETPEHLRELPLITTLRQTWQRHYERATGEGPAHSHPAMARVRFKRNQELPPAAEAIESPYDPEARYRHKCDTEWTGYMVHVSETCEPTTPHLLTQVHTTTAAVYEAQYTALIHQALSAKDLAPQEHFVDGAYISADVLVASRAAHDITLRGPTRGRSKGGKPRLTGLTISPSSRSTGSSGRPGVRRARSRAAGGNIGIARTSRIPSCASASRTVVPVLPGRCAHAPRRRGAACISRRRSALPRSRRPGPGMRVRTAGSSINAVRGWKGQCC
jgi:transposase